MSQIARRKRRIEAMLWLLELSMLAASVLLASRVRFMHDPDTYLAFSEFAIVRALLVAAFITLAMAAFGLYQIESRHRRGDFLLRLVLSFAFGAISLWILYYVLPQAYIGRGVLAIALAVGFILIVCVRWAQEYTLGIESLRRRILVLGAGNNAETINGRLRRRSDRRSFTIVGFLPVPGQAVAVRDELLVRTDCGLAELTQLLQVQEVVVATDERRGALPMEDLLICAQRGVAVTDLSSFFERESGVVSLSIADPSWLVFTGEFDHSMARRLSKRLFDLLAAGSLLLVAWPAMLAVALCIWLDSGRPVLYRQVRVGEDGRSFELLKFRSMRLDAEGDGVARWAANNDNRVTRIGQFIGLTRLDELPQLINVLRGEMSFVGPRPERPQFVDMLNREVRYYSVRHCMKPGLTGWAQLRYPYGASVNDAAEKLRYDLFYVKNHGLLFDLLIMLQTVEVVMFGRGAR